MAALAIVAMLGNNCIPCQVASVTTNVHSSSGGYTFYVRKSGSTELLGSMHLSKDSRTVYNTFTASTNCKETIAYVSKTNTGFQSNRAASLSKNASVIAKKSVTNPEKVYGKCTVSY